MIDELELVASQRPDAAPYDACARDGARTRLMDAAAAARSAPGTARRRMPRWIPVTAAMAATAAVGCVTAGIVQVSRHGGGDRAAAPGSTPSAARLLQQAADAVTGTTPRADQYLRVDYVEHGEAASGAPLGYSGSVWWSVDGRRAPVFRGGYLPGGAVTGRSDSPYYTTPVTVQTPQCSSWRTGYAYTELAALPTDPQALVAQMRRDHSVVTDDNSFWDYSLGLLQYVQLPEAQERALLRALAAQPGLEVAPGVTDVAGRHGVAVRRSTEPESGRMNLVLDPATFRILAVQYMASDPSSGRSAAETTSEGVARMSTAVVDAADVPAGTRLDADASTVGRPGMVDGALPAWSVVPASMC